jgi:Sulfite oxidase and related enzymes
MYHRSSRLPPGQQLAAAHKWPVVGECKPCALDNPWTLEVAGCVARPRVYSLVELAQLPQRSRKVDIHCVTRWSKFDQEFAGVELSQLIAAAQPTAAARFVSFVARSPRDHSTSLPLADALELGTLVATQHAGRPLAVEHGGPVRVIVPERYFYKSVKWLAKIELLADDRLGYWEAVAGYHNHADPWQEERYVASKITRREAAELIRRRDFTGLDLLGLDASQRDLTGLVAIGALLRDANFRRAVLRSANFELANLSNARLQAANVSGASLRGADVEGADFCGADLRHADFRGASIFGATFVNQAEGLVAKIDGSTLFDVDRLDDLFPEQADFVRRAIAAQPE